MHHGGERINSSVFAQVVYLSRVEHKVRDMLYKDTTDYEQMQKYGSWAENTLKPFVAKIM